MMTTNYTARYTATAPAAGTPAAPTDTEPDSGLLADPAGALLPATQPPRAAPAGDQPAAEVAGAVGVTTTSSDQRARYAEIATEAHPAFCAGDPAGCDGVHVSTPVDLTAADKDGDLPVHVYAIATDKDAARYVEVLFEFESGPVSVLLRTRDLADALTDALADAADLLARSEPTWSWTVEQVEAYADDDAPVPDRIQHHGMSA